MKNLSEKVHLEPKAEGLRVMYSLVWLSKAGFSMRQLTYTRIWFLITWSLTSSFPFLRLIAGASAMASRSAT